MVRMGPPCVVLRPCLPSTIRLSITRLSALRPLTIRRLTIRLPAISLPAIRLPAIRLSTICLSIIRLGINQTGRVGSAAILSKATSSRLFSRTGHALLSQQRRPHLCCYMGKITRLFMTLPRSAARTQPYVPTSLRIIILIS